MSRLARRRRRRRRNPSRAAWGWGLASVLALLTFGGAGAALVLKSHSNPPQKRAELEALARKWGPVFGADPQHMITLSKVESSWQPDSVNLLAVTQGGAWGPYQMTKKTAAGWAARLVKNTSDAVRSIAGRWDGQGVRLTRDLELASVLAAAMIGSLTRSLKSFPLVAGAYNRGLGAVLKLQKEGGKFPDDLPGKGADYVARAVATQKAIG